MSARQGVARRMHQPVFIKANYHGAGQALLLCCKAMTTAGQFLQHPALQGIVDNQRSGLYKSLLPVWGWVEGILMVFRDEAGDAYGFLRGQTKFNNAQKQI